jgi:hypothetical protein
MNTDQIDLLWRAAQQSGLPAQQLQTLKTENPYRFSGPVAEAIQSQVAALNPQQARQWIEEAGASLSLAAAAASQGLAPMTPALQAELERLQPRTADEQRQARIAEILQATGGNPWGSPARYEGEQLIPAREASLTAAFELASLDPQLSEQLQAKARPAAQQINPADAAIWQQHGYAIPAA